MGDQLAQQGSATIPQQKHTELGSQGYTLLTDSTADDKIYAVLEDNKYEMFLEKLSTDGKAYEGRIDLGELFFNQGGGDDKLVAFDKMRAEQGGDEGSMKAWLDKMAKAHKAATDLAASDQAAAPESEPSQTGKTVQVDSEANVEALGGSEGSGSDGERESLINQRKVNFLASDRVAAGRPAPSNIFLHALQFKKGGFFAKGGIRRNTWDELLEMIKDERQGLTTLKLLLSAAQKVEPQEGEHHAQLTKQKSDLIGKLGDLHGMMVKTFKDDANWDKRITWIEEFMSILIPGTGGPAATAATADECRDYLVKAWTSDPERGNVQRLVMDAYYALEFANEGLDETALRASFSNQFDTATRTKVLVLIMANEKALSVVRAAISLARVAKKQASPASAGSSENLESRVEAATAKKTAVLRAELAKAWATGGDGDEMSVARAEVEKLATKWFRDNPGEDAADWTIEALRLQVQKGYDAADGDERNAKRDQVINWILRCEEAGLKEAAKKEISESQPALEAEVDQDFFAASAESSETVAKAKKDLENIDVKVKKVDDTLNKWNTWSGCTIGVESGHLKIDYPGWGSWSKWTLRLDLEDVKLEEEVALDEPLRDGWISLKWNGETTGYAANAEFVMPDESKKKSASAQQQLKVFLKAGKGWDGKSTGVKLARTKRIHAVLASGLPETGSLVSCNVGKAETVSAPKNPLAGQEVSQTSLSSSLSSMTMETSPPKASASGAGGAGAGDTGGASGEEAWKADLRSELEALAFRPLLRRAAALNGIDSNTLHKAKDVGEVIELIISVSTEPEQDEGSLRAELKALGTWELFAAADAAGVDDDTASEAQTIELIIAKRLGTGGGQQGSMAGGGLSRRKRSKSRKKSYRKSRARKKSRSRKKSYRR